MHASRRMVTIDRHEWVLKSPAHHTELDQAVRAADAERVRIRDRDHQVGDIQIRAAADEVIVSFEAERPKNPKRSGVAFSTGEAEAANV
ncbi:hypothetical protein ACFVP3_23430 [Streptomyces sp. NPDC057806]|uniref:hypothetical protein n=1 Tax=Streptomyces sp. NPDC057806 TaxID=3346255 RepID=UPI0036946A41